MNQGTLKRLSWRRVVLSLLLGVLSTPTVPMVATGAAAACRIVEGRSIGDLKVGMTGPEALRVTGAPQRSRADGAQFIYILKPPWTEMAVADGFVQRITTRANTCTTSIGIGPGAASSAVREAYATASATIEAPVLGGTRLEYPFLGIAFLLQRNRAVAVEVFAVDRPAAMGAAGSSAPGTSPASPAPSARPAPGGWRILTTSWQLDGSTFIVQGTVQNQGRAQAIFAEVTAFGPGGRVVATSDGPMDRYPVPADADATFEARLPVDDVVTRYTVVVRPMGSITGILTQAAVEIKDLQPFASVVMRRLTVDAEFRTPPTRFLVTVRSRSSITITNATVIVDIEGFCLVRVGKQLRTIPYRGSGQVVVSQIRSGSSAQETMALPPGVTQEGCTDLASATTKARLLSIAFGN